MESHHRIPRFLARQVGAERLRGGFTFLEIVLVILVMGLIFAIAVPRLEGISPKYRLRVAARHLGRQIEDLRLAAISGGETLGIRYYLGPDESSYRIIPGPPPEYPDLPPEDREPLPKRDLTQDQVRIVRVQLRGSRRAIESGGIDVLFSPSGTTGSHSVTLATGENRFMTLELNAITGTVDFFESDTALSPQDFEG